MDFGLARDLERDPSFSGPVGTPAYWAPEQALGEPATPASDVYSFGVVAYRLFTGKLPKRFTQKTNFDLVPQPWRRIVMRCMSERTANRYQTGAELLRAWRTLGSWKNRLPFLVAATIAVVALGVLVLQLGQPTPPSERQRPPEPPSEPAVKLPPTEPPPVVPPMPPVVEATPDAAAVAEPTVTPIAELPSADAGPKATKTTRKKPKPADDIPLFE